MIKYSSEIHTLQRMSHLLNRCQTDNCRVSLASLSSENIEDFAQSYGINEGCVERLEEELHGYEGTTGNVVLFVIT